MINLLIVAATSAEVAFLNPARQQFKTGVNALRNAGNLKVDVLITGPGITATTYHLTHILADKNYDLALNVGICGSLHPDYLPVRVVRVIADQFGDFGAEDGNKWLDIFEIGLAGKNEPPFKNGKLVETYKKKHACLQTLPVSEAITVQRSNGSTASCLKAFKKYGPVMESMEGAAFFYVCRLQNIPCLQIRAVSNKVTRRNRSKWKIKEAIDALAGITGLFMMELGGNA